MVELTDLKEYLRIDADITEDDVLITSLGEAAVSYLEQTTGKAYNDESALMRMAVCQLVLLWYENRTPFTTKTNVNDLPNSLNAIIKHIALAQAYPSKEDAAT
jgi:uncharacterized phage protein (predicted DNA packaging)|nr:MAG TPA: head tail connector [Caudoviricetes sp.]